MGLGFGWGPDDFTIVIAYVRITLVLGQFSYPFY